MRMMGLDIGHKRIGIAFSDPMGITAQPFETYHRKTIAHDMEYLLELIQKHGVTRLVVGLPLHLSGQESQQSAFTRNFAEGLAQRSGLPLYYADERYTSKVAERVLQSAGIRRERRKEYIDKMAATLILQGFMELNENERGTQQMENDEIMQSQEAPEIIELEDENGDVIRMELIMPVDFEDEVYLALMPEGLSENDDEDAYVVFMHVVRGEEEEDDDILEPVEDEALLDKLFAELENVMEEDEFDDE